MIGLGLFAAAALVFLRIKRPATRQGQDFSSVSSTSDAKISSRGIAALDPPLSYFDQYAACLLVSPW
jgi:hypothetical protein